MNQHKRDMERMLTGVCGVYFEHGVGVFVIFQEEKYIWKEYALGYCKHCGKWLGDEHHETIKIAGIFPLDAEGNVITRPECPAGMHETEVGEVWREDGRHFLKDGDRLSVYSKENPDKLLWSGVVKLDCAQFYHVNVDQELWATWFREECPATLIPAEQPKART